MQTASTSDEPMTSMELDYELDANGSMESLDCILFSSQSIHDNDCRSFIIEPIHSAPQSLQDEATTLSSPLTTTTEQSEDPELVIMREMALNSITKTPSFNDDDDDHELEMMRKLALNSLKGFVEHDEELSLERIREEALASIRTRARKQHPRHGREKRRRRELEEGECSSDSLWSSTTDNEDESSSNSFNQNSKNSAEPLRSRSQTSVLSSTESGLSIYRRQPSKYSFRKINISPQMFCSLNMQIDISDDENDGDDEIDGDDEDYDFEVSSSYTSKRSDLEHESKFGQTSEEIEIHDQIKTVRKSIEQNSSQSDEIVARIKDIEEQIESQQMLRSQSSHILEDLHRMIENLQKQVRSHERTIAGFSESINQLESECTSHRRKIEQINAQSSEKLEELDHLNRCLAKSKLDRIPSYLPSNDHLWSFLCQEDDDTLALIDRISPHGKSDIFKELFHNGRLEFAESQRRFNEQNEYNWIRYGRHTYEPTEINFMILSEGNIPLLNDDTDESRRLSHKDFGRTSIQRSNGCLTTIPKLVIPETFKSPLVSNARDFSVVMNELESRYYDFGDSIKTMETKIREDPHDENSWLRLCHLHYTRSQSPKVVLGVLARAVEVHTESSKIWSLYLRALNVVDKSKIDEVIPSVMKWVNRDLYLLTCTLMELDRKQVVRSHANTIIDNAGRDENFWRLLVRVISCIDKTESAEVAYDLLTCHSTGELFDKWDHIELLRLYILAFAHLPSFFCSSCEEAIEWIQRGFYVDWHVGRRSVVNEIEKSLKRAESTLLFQNYVLMTNGKEIGNDSLSKILCRISRSNFNDLNTLSSRELYYLCSMAQNRQCNELRNWMQEILNLFPNSVKGEFSLDQSFNLLAVYALSSDTQSIVRMIDQAHDDVTQFCLYEATKRGCTGFLNFKTFNNLEPFVSCVPRLSTIMPLLDTICYNPNTPDIVIDRLYSMLVPLPHKIHAAISEPEGYTNVSMFPIYQRYRSNDCTQAFDICSNQGRWQKAHCCGRHSPWFLI
ncbi:hypothetical protein ACOME3_000340 [Neoechinorhynchus agilis]